MTDALPAYSASNDASVPTFAARAPNQNDASTTRIPTYEGAVHGILPSAEQVSAYLRLIDGFDQFIKSLNFDPEGLYIYLATAEQRYLQFLKMRPHSDFLPPMDVALIWLVHLVRDRVCLS